MKVTIRLYATNRRSRDGTVPYRVEMAVDGALRIPTRTLTDAERDELACTILKAASAQALGPGPGRDG